MKQSPPQPAKGVQRIGEVESHWVRFIVPPQTARKIFIVLGTNIPAKGSTEAKRAVNAERICLSIGKDWTREG
ncbi:MAG: hypothetical protein ACRDF4_10020 [Rhabdochlamydiaceae bacterium]